MTLVQLEYIVAVDNYKSFVSAAQHSFVTQPTLSMQIQKLEDELGLKIFDRSRQPIIATEAGAEIIKQARIVLNETKRIKEIVADRKGEMEGEIRLGIIPTVAPYLLPRVLGNFMAKYPKLRLKIWEYTTEKIVDEIKRGMLDCGILSTPLHQTNIEEYPLFYEAFVTYLSKHSPLHDKKLVTANDILGEKLWLLNEGHCMRNQVMNICNKERSMHPDKLFEYNTGSVETLKRMVDSNSGVTIMPELSISEFNEEELENVRYFKNPEPVREISLVTKGDYLKTKAIEALKAEIIATLPSRYTGRRKMEVMSINST
ncbi:hydrogen peroxide-inducible genes activator [Olivibacter sitiensis]|uniref:hydrogen peroxide-inducible genes activator n=1 Tax=Olivibacter sitiensis TaxID=376470 RepID=UPI0004884CB8|nr:hydrogen peroxide-inducible genes activator [Olivibacter sitiensis]